MYHAIVFLPLIGALIAGFGGRAIGAKASEYVTTLFLIVAALLSWVAFFTVAMGDGEMVRVPIMRWIDSGGFSVDWAFRIDTLTAVMLVVVNTVSCAGAHLFDRLHAP
jgi:NADH-quinone oxidoreductase subunit L